jgi:hypothetical protein
MCFFVLNSKGLVAHTSLLVCGTVVRHNYASDLLNCAEFHNIICFTSSAVRKNFVSRCPMHNYVLVYIFTRTYFKNYSNFFNFQTLAHQRAHRRTGYIGSSAGSSTDWEWLSIRARCPMHNYVLSYIFHPYLF